jgi:hypothetical protein
MWGARGPFPLAAAMVVAVVMPVVFCAKATEKRNKNTKLSWWLAKSLFITIYCKTYCNSYIANSSVTRAQVVAWPEPKPLWSNGCRVKVLQLKTGCPLRKLFEVTSFEKPKLLNLQNYISAKLKLN